MRRGSQTDSTRDTARLGTNIQLTSARVQRISRVCSAEKPAVAKKLTFLRSRIMLRQFAPRRNTYSSTSAELEASISPSTLIHTTEALSHSVDSLSPSRRVVVNGSVVVIAVI